MSELQLSDQLVDAVRAAIASQDPRASDDMIAVQYLAALQGYMMGSMSLPTAQMHDILQQLAAFSQHVAEDMARQSQPKQEAFGIWKPEKK